MALPIFIGEKMAKHILSCSFGKDSIATALLALQHGEPLDELVYCEVMFSEEISGELPEHNRFIHETAIPYFEQRGIPTRVLRSEKTYLSCFYHVVTRGKTKGMLSGFPLSGRCTIQRDCKLPPIKAYQKALPPDTVQYIGIAADEPKRLARLKPGQISLLDKYHVAEPEARSMCAALGNNLNQLAHIANASGKVSNTDLLTAKQIMEQIWRYIKGGEAADQMVREALQVTEVAIKLSALGIKNALALSLAYAKENPKVKGKTSLDRLLREGKELKIIALQSKDVGQFKELAKQYGVLFAVIKDKAQNEKVDVMFKAEDVAKLNRIYEQLGYAIPKVTTADRKKDPTRRQSGDSLLTRGKNPLDIDPRPSVRATIMALKNAARTAAQAQEKVQDITAKEER